MVAVQELKAIGSALGNLVPEILVKRSFCQFLLDILPLPPSERLFSSFLFQSLLKRTVWHPLWQEESISITKIKSISSLEIKVNLVHNGRLRSSTE